MPLPPADALAHAPPADRGVEPINLASSAAPPASVLPSAAAPDAARSQVVPVDKALQKGILVADDNKVNLLLAAKMLQSLGYIMETVDKGQQVLDALLRQEFDLVLMSCQMPEMDGFAATQAIRDSEKQQGGHIPIVALTAKTFPEVLQRCLDSGIDAFLGKSIRKENSARRF